MRLSDHLVKGCTWRPPGGSSSHLRPPLSSPPPLSVTFIWFSPGISDGTTPEIKKKWGVQNFTRNLNPPPSPMWILRPPSSRLGRYEQLANRLRNSCFSASSFSRTAASAFQEAAVSNSFPLLSFPFPPHMLSWPCAALKYTCSQYFCWKVSCQDLVLKELHTLY